MKKKIIRRSGDFASVSVCPSDPLVYERHAHVLGASAVFTVVFSSELYELLSRLVDQSH